MIREVQAKTTEPPSSPCACSKIPRKPSILFLWRSRSNASCAPAATMHVDKDACRSRGLIVTNVVAVFATDSTDHAGGILVAMLRKVVAPLMRTSAAAGGRPTPDSDYPLATKVSRYSRKKKWQVSSKLVGIVGLGNICSRIVRVLAIVAANFAM